jgi:hypothetical protein
LIICFAAHAESEFKIFTLQYHFASDLLPVNSSIVGYDDIATGINNQLNVHTNLDRMREIELTVAQLDNVRVNNKISIQSNNSLRAKQKDIETSGSVNRYRGRH